MKNAEYIKNKLCKLNLEADDSQCEQLADFYEMLIRKNEVMNLTAITEFPDVVEKHFMDSLAFRPEKEEAVLIDVGTGAGFPGIPLKIMYPKLQITLMDSLNKRLVFLQEVIGQLGLSGIRTVHGRAEDLGRDREYREQYDYCVSRAVANLSTLSEYCLPFVKTGGYFVSYKSGKSEEELKAAEYAFHVLSGKFCKAEVFTIPDTEMERSLIWIKKSAPMSHKYPRKAGIPSKEPLHA